MSQDGSLFIKIENDTLVYNFHDRLRTAIWRAFTQFLTSLLLFHAFIVHLSYALIYPSLGNVT